MGNKRIKELKLKMHGYEQIFMTVNKSSAFERLRAMHEWKKTNEELKAFLKQKSNKRELTQH